MKNTKKVTYKQLAANLPEQQTITVSLGEEFNGIEVVVKKRLTMKELSALSSDIANAIVDMKEGDYTPEYTQLIYELMVLKHYAGIDIGKNELGTAYRVLSETDLYEVLILTNVDREQVAEAIDNAERRIEWLKQTLLCTAGHKAIELLNGIEHMMGALGGSFSDLNEINVGQMMEHLNSITNALTPHDVDEQSLIPGA